jgi:peptide methionine sulfoxide reductase msrA/msrB
VYAQTSKGIYMKKLFLFLGLSLTLMAKTQTIVFGAGCFWGVEKYYDNLDGVLSASAGYAGGNYENPTYDTVLKQRDATKGIINHTEVVQVVYDDSKVSTVTLIKSFWELHNPTQGNRQGHDVGNNYRSAIFYTSHTQKKLAFSTKNTYQALLKKSGYGVITTEIKSLNTFYKAAGYHQNYLQKNPNGYCPNHATGVKFKNEQTLSKKISPLGAKEIIVIDSENCSFCEKFKKNITGAYNGSIPLRTAKQNDLNGFTITSKIQGTPTILLIEDGKEVYAHTGYMNGKDFYKLIGAFKLGDDSEAFDVAYNKNTDSKFCKKYKEFSDTGDGVFIDKISGDVLFDAKDRFNSGTGWLSFYKAVDGATLQKEDNAYGMQRVELIAKKSGAHLGHVFNDAPGGRKRFCINATILEFVARDKVKP